MGGLPHKNHKKLQFQRLSLYTRWPLDLPCNASDLFLYNCNAGLKWIKKEQEKEGVLTTKIPLGVTLPLNNFYNLLKRA